MKVVALAGGTGSAKLLRGLTRLSVDLTVVANVGDNAWMYGVYVCPDIDIACYTLTGIADTGRGWGIAGDTFEIMSSIEKAGVQTWFRLGDRDFANCLARTELMRSGATLTQATEKICKALGSKFAVLPVTDSHVETRITTPKGDLHLQEFWVRDRGKPTVKRVWYKGAKQASVTKEVSRVLDEADKILLCPANPVTSIGPMLAVPGFVSMLRRTKAELVAISPMENGSPFSGPAGKLMKAMGVDSSSVGVASLYSGFLDRLMISERDVSMADRVRSLGLECVLSNTLISSPGDELRLARELVEN